MSTFCKQLSSLIQKNGVFWWLWLWYIMLKQYPAFFCGADITFFHSCLQQVASICNVPFDIWDRVIRSCFDEVPIFSGECSASSCVILQVMNVAVPAFFEGLGRASYVGVFFVGTILSVLHSLRQNSDNLFPFSKTFLLILEECNNQFLSSKSLVSLFQN